MTAKEFSKCYTFIDKWIVTCRMHLRACYETIYMHFMRVPNNRYLHHIVADIRIFIKSAFKYMT